MVNILKLKARLKEKNLTQEDMAKRLGINPSTLNKKINDEAGEYLTIDEAEKDKRYFRYIYKRYSRVFF